MSDFGVPQILNIDLRDDHLPSPRASWPKIEAFALTFDAYEHWGSFEKCAEIANGRDHSTLTNLRTCLFFEQRRWRHFEENPNAEALAYMRGILRQIRSQLRRGELE